MYDLIIIGSGVSGLAAAVYAVRFGMKTLILGEFPGGIVTTTHLIENYPGFPSITGLDLANRLKEHAISVGATFEQKTVTEIAKLAKGFKVSDGKNSWEARSLILATGTKNRTLGIPGEAEFKNKGVSYCATCDGPFFRNKVVAIIGGSDSAVKESLFLAQHAAKVYIVYRGEEVHPEPITLERMKANPKIEVINKTNVTEILGTNKVEKLKLDSGKELPVDGVFMAIGYIPRSEFASSIGVTVNEKKEIVIDGDSRTNVPFIYAAGDVTNSEWKQVITGVAQGVKASHSAFEDLISHA